MNFFRKKNQIIVSFGVKELDEPVHKLKKSLLDLAPFPSGGAVRLNATEAVEIPLSNLAVLVSFSMPVREAGAKIELKVKENVLNAIQGAGVEDFFDILEAG